MWCLSKKFDNCFLCCSLLVQDFVGVLKIMLFDNWYNLYQYFFFLMKWHFFLLWAFVPLSALCWSPFQGIYYFLWYYFTLLYLISNPRKFYQSLSHLLQRKKINFHVWFDDIFSRCTIFYFGLTCWQLVSNQVISGIMILYLHVFMQ